MVPGSRWCPVRWLLERFLAAYLTDVPSQDDLDDYIRRTIETVMP